MNVKRFKTLFFVRNKPYNSTIPKIFKINICNISIYPMCYVIKLDSDNLQWFDKNL